MPPPNKDAVKRSRKNRDKARNEPQKSLLLAAATQRSKMLELIKQTDRLQIQSHALLEESHRTLRKNYTKGE